MAGRQRRPRVVTRGVLTIANEKQAIGISVLCEDVLSGFATDASMEPRLCANALRCVLMRTASIEANLHSVRIAEEGDVDTGLSKC